MRPVLAALAALTVAVVATGVAAAGNKERPRVTFIGDSVAASLDFVDGARRHLSRGFDMRLELDVCRRLVDPSCTYRGNTPPTALQVIRSKGRSLGRVVAVMVGYNDYASDYRAELGRVMKALRRARVRTVIWVTLTETRENYRLINRVIRREAKRRPRLRLADWAKLSRGKSWFAGDGLHLEPDGAMALARLVRGKVRAAT